MRGKRRQGTSVTPPGRALFAVTVTVSVGLACGSRSTLLEEEPGDYESGASGSGFGGSASHPTPTGGLGAVTGTGGSAGPGGSLGRGGSGGVSTQGGGYGRGGGSTRGGSPATAGGGSGAYPTGGTYGRGGTGFAGYPGGSGGNVSYGGYSGTGTGASAGRAGRGTGGSVSAGRSGSGGFAGGSEGGRAGQAGTAGMGAIEGSPTMRAQCDALCHNNPPACTQLSDNEADCLNSCYPAAYQNENCELELADYARCIAGLLRRDARCTVEAGGCYGQGCLTTAIDACSGADDAFNQCENGNCRRSVETSSASCSYESTCETHWHGVYCTLGDATSAVWTCTCYVDGHTTFNRSVYGQGESSCQSLVTDCNLSK